MTLRSAYSVSFNGTVLAGLTTLDSQINPELEASVGIGSPFPQFSVIRGIKPQINFQSRSIAAALAITGMKGKTIDTVGPLVAAFVSLDDSDGSIGTATQIYTLAKGIVLPRQLSCSHGQDATLDVQAIGRSADGSTHPLVIGTGTPATLVRDNTRLTIKTAEVAGVTIDDIVQIQIDFGVSAQAIATNSDIFPKYISNTGGVTPKITITTNDLAAVASLTANGSRGVHSDTSVTFREYDDEDVGFAANDMEFTASGVAIAMSGSGQGPQTASATIEITCDWDGTNDPIKLTA